MIYLGNAGKVKNIKSDVDVNFCLPKDFNYLPFKVFYNVKLNQFIS